MKELLDVWTDGRKIAAIAIVAVVYASLLIAFKDFVLIPQYSTVRPGNFVPLFFGVVFGPAAAWGSAFGNLGGDYFSGTLTSGSAFGFIGNFAYAYVAYLIWVYFTKNEKVGIDATSMFTLELSAFAGGVVCALVIAAGLFMLGNGANLAAQMLVIVTFNNFVPAAILGPACMFLFYRPLLDAGWVYRDGNFVRAKG